MAKKIPTALVRDPNNRSKVLNEITPGCEWVFEGEGVPTRKWEGTCVMLDIHGQWWARREIKPGKTPPDYYVVIDHDEVTGKTQGWEPMAQSPFVKFHEEALSHLYTPDELSPGTYELIGPKINGNPEKTEVHMLARHAIAPIAHELINTPLCSIRNALDRWCDENGAEGVVWHHPDGRMAKLKARDL